MSHQDVKPLDVSRADEAMLMETLVAKINKQYPDVSAANTLVLMVSPDYSATVAMHVAHALSKDGEMCDILPIHVSYPDESSEGYLAKARHDIQSWLFFAKRDYDCYLLVEAGVIRGGTYTWLTNLLDRVVSGKVITATLCENVHSVFKSDVVGRYYDADKEDLTFYYERENKHWK